MTQVVWFHCFAGIAGDMALGSLLDAGAELDSVRELLSRLPLGGWGLEAEPVLRGGLAATRAVVEVRDDTVVRTHAHIVGLIEEARLPARVRDRSLAAFAALAQVEGRLHGRPAAQVHFHEVGGHDAMVDIVGTCAALEVLGIELVFASPVATGTGVVRTAHGLLPNPSPAVVALLAGAPVEGRGLKVELTTPTGAALLAAMAVGYGPLPAMRVEATGYGAGSAELDGLPNVLQVVVGEASGPRPLAPGGRGPGPGGSGSGSGGRGPGPGGPGSGSGGRGPGPGGSGSGSGGSGSGQPLVLLEANLDDATGEVLAHSVAALLEAGALDAWVTPVLMKKGRPGHVVSVLAEHALVTALVAVMAAETGTLGVRSHVVSRWAASRSVDEVDVDGWPVRVKVSPGRVKAEHDDAARVARRRGRPLREVLTRAEDAWRRAEEQGADPPAGPRGPNWGS
ncbi:MAG: nickel pincer cofactor biosynthesis protein LarC [Acidimicrobiales bacterium]